MPINMGDQFRGLPMGDLIGGPLMAACDAQVRLANATADFIRVVGFLPPTSDAAAKDPNAIGDVRTVTFRYERPVAGGDGNSTEQMKLEVPLLAVVKVPSLGINKVDITFDMEVKNSERTAESEDKSGKFDASITAKWGPVTAKVNVSGSVASHKENTRQTDQSAKYHVEVHAEDKGMPEGLSRVLDILSQSVAPKQVANSNAGGTPAKSSGTGLSSGGGGTPTSNAA